MTQIIAITGISGLLGGNLAAALGSGGVQVRGIVRPQSKIGHLAHLDVDWRQVDSPDRDQLEAVFRGVSAVFHCAGSTVQSRWLRPEHRAANIEMAQTVLAAARAAKVARLVHCSSTTTCGLSVEGRPVGEVPEDGAAITWFEDGYSRSKRLAEDQMLRAAADFDIVVVNPGFMLGPLDARPSSGQMILSVARGLARGWPAGHNNFVDVRDVSAGMIAALERGRRGERYILGGENLAYRQIMTLIAERLGVRPPGFAIPRALAGLAGWAGDAAEIVSGSARDINTATVRYGFCRGMRFSSARAVRELDYRWRPVGQAVDAAIAWFRQAGMIGGSGGKMT